MNTLMIDRELESSHRVCCWAHQNTQRKLLL